jgi:hypothetical protein
MDIPGGGVGPGGINIIGWKFFKKKIYIFFEFYPSELSHWLARSLLVLGLHEVGRSSAAIIVHKGMLDAKLTGVGDGRSQLMMDGMLWKLLNSIRLLVS